MAAPLRVEERLSSLEARMTAVEQLRDEMRTGHVMIVTALTEQIEESRRYTRVLHEDVLGRIRVIVEGLAAQTAKIASQDDKLARHGEKLASLDDKLASQDDKLASQNEKLTTLDEKLATLDGKLATLDGKLLSQGEKITTLSAKIDAARGETRLMFEQVFARLDAPRTPPKRKRR